MGKYYVIIGKDKSKEEMHFDAHGAKEAVDNIRYTDKAGAAHHGAYWTMEQIKTVTEPMKFPKGTTDWDRYVAFNSFYADLCKVLDEPTIIKAAHAFYFADEDAPEGKVKRYMDAMKEWSREAGK